MVLGPDHGSSATAPSARSWPIPRYAESGTRVIQGRSLGQIAWTRLKRDKVALAGGVVVILLILVAIFAPLIVKLLGHPPNEFHQDLCIDPDTAACPTGRSAASAGTSSFGVEPVNGRDIFSRVVYGARISLLIAFLATLLSVVIGTVLGVIAGYFGGWVDTLISRAMDVFLAFPLLLFAIALVGVIPDQAFGLSGDALRIVAADLHHRLLQLAATSAASSAARRCRCASASSSTPPAASAPAAPYIIFREMLPNLIAPILVYATLLIPTNILFEAALSFLGVGVRPPTADLGRHALRRGAAATRSPHFMLWPGLAIFITVLAFNLFGDGLRDALDPEGAVTLRSAWPARSGSDPDEGRDVT